VQRLIEKGIAYPFRNESDIKEFHDKIIDSFGGCRGIITDANITQAVLESIQQGNTRSHKETIVNKAASLMFNIIHGHPFTDGNKRTGLSIAEIFIHLNGYEIINDGDNLYNITLKIA
jgi:death-on-curing protein